MKEQKKRCLENTIEEDSLVQRFSIGKYMVGVVSGWRSLLPRES